MVLLYALAKPTMKDGLCNFMPDWNLPNSLDTTSRAGFFLTSAVKKTKTQAQNSSQKLKEKTQPHGGTFFILRKTQEKNSILPIFLFKMKLF